MENLTFARLRKDYAPLDNPIILIDSSSLIKTHAFSTLMQICCPLMENRPFLIPRSCITELANSIVQRAAANDPGYINAVVSTIQGVDELTGKKVLRLIGAAEDTAAEVILEYVMLNRKKGITVITQDPCIAEDIGRINSFQSISFPPVLVRRLTPHGSLEEFSCNDPLDRTRFFPANPQEHRDISENSW